MTGRFKNDQEIMLCRYGAISAPVGRKPGKRVFTLQGLIFAAAVLVLVLVAVSF